MSRLVRPVWIATWVAQAYALLVLLPAMTHVYGPGLPGWSWVGAPIQSATCLFLAAFQDIRGRGGAWTWVVAAMASTGTSFFMVAGAWILLTFPLTLWDRIGLGAFGVFCLLFLVAIDRLGYLLGSRGLQAGSSDDSASDRRVGTQK